MREYVDVELECQKTYYDRSKYGYGSNYRVGKEVLVFNPTVIKEETRKFTASYRRPYIIFEIKNDLNFKVEDKKTRKAINVQYDRLKKYKTRAKSFTPEPQANRKTTIKEQKNTELNSSDDDDINEIESSAVIESNLNTENQSEAEDDIDSINVTNDTSENEAKESEHKTSKGQEKAQIVAEWGGATSSKPTEYTGKKSAETKIPKTEKKPQKSSCKTKSTEEKINSDPKAPKTATRSSSRLKSVPEKLKNFLMIKMKRILAARKLMMFLFQKNPERNNGIEKKDEFIRSIVWWNITMFVSGIASNFCFSITLYQVIRLWLWQYRITEDLFSRS